MYIRQCDWCGKVMPADNYHSYVELRVYGFKSNGHENRDKYYHLCKACYDKFKKIKVE